MARIPFCLLIVGLLLSVSLVACDEDNPVTPKNHNPVIFSVAVFPASISTQDSIIAICNAMDSDADTLVYDWVTDGRLNIKGAVPGQHFLYNTFANSQVFYPAAVSTPVDTAWLDCSARDHRGGSATKLVRFEIHQ